MTPAANFDEIVATHHAAVTAYARALCSDRTVADDAVQETFFRAWRYLDTYRSSGSFEGWLLAICRRCVIDLAERDTRHRGLADHRHRAPEQPEQPDHRADIIDLVAGLPLPQREVLVLCGWLGYDYADAAAILGVPVGTVRSRLHRARQALAGLLDQGDHRDQAGFGS